MGSGREGNRGLGVAGLYRWLLRLHSSIPYYLFPWGGAFPPVHYYLEVTRRCNLRCQMCQYIKWLKATTPAEQQAGELTTDEWKNVIDQTGRFSLLTFTGGEPWVRPDFTELLEYACTKRMVHCISNCTLLTQERVERCVALAPKRLGAPGFVSLGVSLDAPGARHDAIRGQQGAFEKATSAVKALTQRREALGQRWPMVHVTSVIQEANVDVLPAMPEVVRSLGANTLNLTMEIRFMDIEGLGEIDPCSIEGSEVTLPRIDRPALEKALPATIEAAQRSGIALRLPRMPVEQIVQYYSGGVDLGRYECRMPWTTMTIGRDGRVYPCFIQKVGDVRQKKLKHIWNGPEMRAFRQHCRDHLWPVCQGCCEIELRH